MDDHQNQHEQYEWMTTRLGNKYADERTVRNATRATACTARRDREIADIRFMTRPDPNAHDHLQQEHREDTTEFVLGLRQMNRDNSDFTDVWSIDVDVKGAV